ncbi:hypothetical protein B5P43_15860 [Bacillus sp. SRB_336]|nr:hypothetical protein B5P43_15860 [Bacillus sp. SRB_336]
MVYPLCAVFFCSVLAMSVVVKGGFVDVGAAAGVSPAATFVSSCFALCAHVSCVLGSHAFVSGAFGLFRHADHLRRVRRVRRRQGSRH